MSRLTSSFKKWILGILVASLTGILSGEIFEAFSEDDSCLFLKSSCERVKYFGQIPIIFVDIDNTIIKGSSDFNSYGTFSDFRHTKCIAPRLTQMLRELYDHNNIKILGLTSAKGWQIVENPKEYFDLLPYFIARKIVKKQNNSYQYFLCPHSPDSPQVIEKKSVPEIRSEAMASLGFPFEESFGSVTVVLHPVMTSYSRLPPGPFQRGHFFLRNHEILAYHFPEQNSPLQRQNIFCDFFVRNTKNGGNYKKIIACPVYENGVIFSNFIDQKNAWQKGPIVRSFLFSLLGKNRGSWPPLTAIAIDDNLQMLISIQKYCDILEIPFIGIHLAYREKSVPTRLLMQGTFKKNYFYD